MFKKNLYTILLGRRNHGDIWYIFAVIVFLRQPNVVCAITIIITHVRNIVGGVCL